MVDPREMPAGAELDKRIAREVFDMEWSSLHGAWRTPDGLARAITLPSYSTDPAASAELKAKLWEMGFSVEISLFDPTGDKPFCMVSCWASSGHKVTNSVPITGPDPRPAEFLAFARCALEAVRARKGAK